VIRVSDLSKRFGSRLALDRVSFEVGQGEVVGFLGPNGAGKTTTLRILAGVLGPTEGTVSIAGHDVVEESFEARRSIGYMPESVPLYPEMRVVEYLSFRAELKQVPRRQRAGAVEEAMEKAGVLDAAHRRIAHLSKGYRQRVGIADAIVAKPAILVLDEPTAGLDPNQIRQARALVRELGRDHAVLLSTHILSEVEACATRVLLIHRGRLVAQGPTAEICAMGHVSNLDLIVRGDARRAARTLGSIAGVRGVTHGETTEGVTRMRAHLVPDVSEIARRTLVEQTIAALVQAEIGVQDVRLAGGSLEDVFAELTDPTAESAR
jgi:ABC-2 type transport system ATP-binding protein